MNKKLIGLMGLFAIFSFFLSPFVALATGAPTNISLTPTRRTPPQLDPMNVFAKVITWIFGVLMVLVVIMILVAGYMFVTGGGNPEQIGKARTLLMYALIGLAIAVLARGIMGFVLKILW